METEGRSITVLDKARSRLNSLKETVFMGEEEEIYKLSVLYNRMVFKYTGKKCISLPFTPKKAKITKNWNSFKKLLLMLKEKEFPFEPYLEVQFKQFKLGYRPTSLTYPYPNMLYSIKAQNSFTNSFKYHLSNGNTDSLGKTELEQIKRNISNSIKLINRIKSSWPDIPEIAIIVDNEDMIDPVYLATHVEYMQLVNKTYNEIPEELYKVITRLNKDSIFKRDVLFALSELKHE